MRNRKIPNYSLTDAIISGMQAYKEYELIPVSMLHSIREEVLEFLSQKFNAAILRQHGNKECEKVLMDLWKKIKPDEIINRVK